jgi:hypothetical protein
MDRASDHNKIIMPDTIETQNGFRVHVSFSISYVSWLTLRKSAIWFTIATGAHSKGRSSTILLGSVSPLFTQNTPRGVTIESGSNLSKYLSTDSFILLQSVLPSKYAAIDHRHFWSSMNPSLPPLLCSILLWGPRSNESNTSRFEYCFKIR